MAPVRAASVGLLLIVYWLVMLVSPSGWFLKDRVQQRAYQTFVHFICFDEAASSAVNQQRYPVV